MEREWREAIDLRSSLLSIGIVVAVGGLLRSWHLGRGWVAPIESDIMEAVTQLLHTGAYRPAALVRPTLPVYLQAAVAIVHFLWGALIGAWQSIAAYGAEQMIDWGRAWSALLGTAVVLIVYQVGMRWGARHALLGAGLMAVTPMHVGASREIGYGAPLTFFTVLALLLSLKAGERATRRGFVAAGAASGLAAACHYAGAIALVMPLVSAWMTHSDESPRAARAFVVIAAALGAFVVATPLSVRDLPAFLDGFAATAAPSAGASGVVHVDLLGQLLEALQWPGVILAFAGLCLAVVRAITGPGHTRWTILASFPLVYFTLLAWHGATSEAVVLPMLPAVTLLAAIAVISGVSQLRRFDIPRPARTALIAALTVAAVLPPAVLSIELVRQQSREAGAGLETPIERATSTGR
jgi:4-amino-4-deoxy-L-arabinose transferase-like glycosyltransferase